MKHWYPRNIREEAEKLESNGELKFIKAEIVKHFIYFRECDLYRAEGVGPYPHLVRFDLDLVLCNIYGTCNHCYKLEDIRDIQEFMTLIKAKDSSNIIGSTILLVFHGMKLLTISVEKP